VAPQWVGRVDLGVPVGSHDQYLAAGQLAGGETQQLQGWGVRPVQVVEHHQQRTTNHERAHQATDGFEEAEPRILRVVCLRCGPLRLRERPAQLGDDMGQLRRRWAYHRPQRRHVEITDERAQHLRPWPERRRSLPFETTTPRHHRAANGTLPDQLGSQTRLADARFARHQHHATPASLRPIESTLQLSQLSLAPHQRPARISTTQKWYGGRQVHPRAEPLRSPHLDRRRRIQRRRLLKDVLFELAQRRPRLQAQLFPQGGAQRCDSTQGGSLSAAAVQGESEEFPASLPQRLLTHQPFQFAHHPCVPAEGQLRLHQRLATTGPQLNQPSHLGLNNPRQPHVGIRCPPPPRQCRSQHLYRLPHPTGSQQSSPLCHSPLEPRGIQRLRIHPEDIARRSSHHHLRTLASPPPRFQHPTQIRDIHLQRARRLRRRLRTPQPINQPILRHHPISVQQQHRQHRPRHPRTNINQARAVPNLHRPQDPELHRPTPLAGKPILPSASPTTDTQNN
jgi:hypothetical protein